MFKIGDIVDVNLYACEIIGKVAVNDLIYYVIDTHDEHLVDPIIVPECTLTETETNGNA